MSFLKYVAEAGNSQRGPVSFARAHVDGMPFRGPTIPLKEDEYREYTEVVNDFGAQVLDVRKPEEYAQLQEIFDRAVNGWYNILEVDKRWGSTDDGTPTVHVFVMYAVPHRELAKGRAQAELLPSPVPTF